ncbi:MAG: GerMN domain-containing protein [Clostridiales bacterium]|nr:GerMN domain-containing protein [Clostridiales bacterium]
MRKLVLSLIGILMVLSLAACTPTTDKNKTGSVKETQGALTAADKVPDATAPDLIVVSVYEVNEEGTGLKGTMDAVETLDADSLVELLIEYGVLEEYTEVNEYSESGESAAAAGPGVSGSESVISGAVLDLDQLPDDGKDEMVLKAIARTMMENLNTENIQILLNGEVVAENISMSELE